jgi:REP element-mobilizing transposase RayT
MARLPRIVIPGLPHYVTQRGNRRSQVFFEEGDYELYLDLLGEAAVRSGTEIWCYCLMPNHVHLVAVPSDKDGLRQTFADAHRRYTGYINARSRATGHLWQGRFGSVVMDEAHLFYAGSGENGDRPPFSTRWYTDFSRPAPSARCTSARHRCGLLSIRFRVSNLIGRRFRVDRVRYPKHVLGVGRAARGDSVACVTCLFMMRTVLRPYPAEKRHLAGLRR